MENWEFDCPQFIDFAAALNSPSNEVFYDVSYDGPTTAGESDVGPKMATPKIKPNDPLKNHPFINFCTDDEKIATLSKLHGRLSKSDGCLNQIIEKLKTPEEKDNHVEDRKKRRSSFPNIKKRRVCPTTPNCLKRYVKNSKLRNAKTSEELELQKIAMMQDMLHKHLKLNKINLKRLKMNKAPFTLEKLSEKCEPKTPGKKNRILALPSKPAPASNRNLHYQNDAACGTATSSKGLPERLQNQENPIEVLKKKAPSNVLRDHNAQKRDTEKNIKKMPLLEKYSAHGGLRFIPHQGKTIQCPFSFDSSYASSQNSINRSKLRTPLSISKNPTENKENLLQTPLSMSKNITENKENLK